jgi:uncharacterized protein (TIGR02246 family)
LAWGQALGEDDPHKVLPFYLDDAVLWGTLSPTVRSDRAALREYFVTASKVLPSLKVALGDQRIRVCGNAAVDTGYYTFSYVEDGETKNLPARYSFTYVKNGERWLIVGASLRSQGGPHRSISNNDTRGSSTVQPVVDFSLVFE